MTTPKHRHVRKPKEIDEHDYGACIFEYSEGPVIDIAVIDPGISDANDARKLATWLNKAADYIEFMEKRRK